MADFLASKGSTEVVSRRWLVPVDSDDGAASVSASASGVTLDAYALEGDELVLTLSGGTTGATGYVDATVTTSRGRELVARLYVPVIGPGVLAETVQDVIAFALRKVTGIGETPDADQAADALERLQDMLDMWRLTGADLGAPSPLELTSVIYCPDGYLHAVKNNLIVQLSDLYGAELSPVVVQNARYGLALVKNRNLSDTRAAVYY